MKHPVTCKLLDEKMRVEHSSVDHKTMKFIFNSMFDVSVVGAHFCSQDSHTQHSEWKSFTHVSQCHFLAHVVWKNK